MTSMVTQLMRMPLVMAGYVFDMLGTTAKGLDRIAQESLSTAAMGHTIERSRLLLPASPSACAASTPDDAPLPPLQPAMPGNTSPVGPSKGPPPAISVSKPLTVAPSASGHHVIRHKESSLMSYDRNLNDNQVKLVEYTLVTIQRQHERLLEGPKQMLVTDDLSGDAFSNARVAEWFRRTGGRVRNGDGGSIDLDLDTLRVFYKVLDRWPKEDLKFDERTLQYDREAVAALREIADRI